MMQWHSERLDNSRRVWILTIGDEAPEERPLAILLDGQFWAENMPVWPALASLTHQRLLPGAVYLLIDAIDTQHRSRVALQCRLLAGGAAGTVAASQSRDAFSDDAGRTVVAGQSFGGLSALYAGLNWPTRFGCVLSQSGSFWWPHRITPPEGKSLPG